MKGLDERIRRAAVALDESADAYASRAVASRSSRNDAAEDNKASEARGTSLATVAALRRPQRRRRLLVIAACLVALLVAGGVVLLTQTADNTSNVSVKPAATPPFDSDAALPFAVPGDMAEITNMGVSTPPSAQDSFTYFTQSYGGSLDGTNVSLDVSVHVFSESVVDKIGPACAPGTPVLRVNGYDGCESKVNTGQGLREDITWQVDRTSRMYLQAYGMSVDQLLALAPTVKRSADRERATLDPVPDGLQPSGTHMDPDPNDQGEAEVSFIHNGCKYALHRQVADLATLPQGSATMTIAGYPGAVIGKDMIAWGVRGSMISLGLEYFSTPEGGQEPIPASCDVQATAATIHYIDAATWNQLLADHRSTVPTT
jgi:hypothetical protein